MLAGYGWRRQFAFGPAAPHVLLAGLTALRALAIGGRVLGGEEMVSFRAKNFDRARGAMIYTLNLPDELAAHASAADDLTRLGALAAGGRLDGQVVARRLE